MGAARLGCHGKFRSVRNGAERQGKARFGGRVRDRREKAKQGAAGKAMSGTERVG